MLELDGTGARVLDATVQVLVDFGFKRATVELVAKYAGVSQMTVNRRWPSKDELLQAAVLREFTTVFDTVVRDLDDSGTFDDKVVRGFTAVVWSLRNHPLMTRELKTEPETVLPLLTAAAAPTMQTAVSLVAQRLRRSAQASGVELADPEALADILVRLAHAVLLLPHPERQLATRIDIADYAQRYIRPVIRHVSGGAPERPRPKPRRSPVGLLTAAAMTALVGTAAATSWVAYSSWPNVAPLDSVKSTTRPTTQPSVTSAPPPVPVYTAPPPPVALTSAPAPQVVWSPPPVSSSPPTGSVTAVLPATTPSQDSETHRGPLNWPGGMGSPMMPPMGPALRPGLLPGHGLPPSKPPSRSPSVSTGTAPKVASAAKAHAGKAS